MNDTIFAVELNANEKSEAELYCQVCIAEDVQFTKILNCAKCGGECKVF